MYIKMYKLSTPREGSRLHTYISNEAYAHTDIKANTLADLLTIGKTLFTFQFKEIFNSSFN
jgi:hypothetical protein